MFLSRALNELDECVVIEKHLYFCTYYTFKIHSVWGSL